MKRGSIDIRSGRWDWFVGEVISLTDGTIERKTLHFYDPKNQNNNMAVRLYPSSVDLDQMTVEELARYFVEARSVQDTDGIIWRVTIGSHSHLALSIPLDEEQLPHPGKLLVFKAGESARVRILPFKASKTARSINFEKSEFSLGELMNDELLNLIVA